MDKDVVHIMEYYSALKKNETIPFATTQMNLESIMVSEVSQIEKDKYYKFSLICGIYRIQQTSKYNRKRNKLTDIENKLVVYLWGEGRGGRGG